VESHTIVFKGIKDWPLLLYKGYCGMVRRRGRY
jgi:hypothetical protein